MIRSRTLLSIVASSALLASPLAHGQSWSRGSATDVSGSTGESAPRGPDTRPRRATGSGSPTGEDSPTGGGTTGKGGAAGTGSPTGGGTTSTGSTAGGMGADIGRGDVEGRPGHTGGSGHAMDDTALLALLHRANAMGIALGRLGSTRAGSPGVRDFARRMLDAHTRSDQEITRIAGAKALTIEGRMTLPDMEAEHRRAMAELERLRGLKGAEFDRAFVAAVTRAHDGLVRIVTSIQPTGTVSREQLQKLLPGLKERGEEARRLQRDLE